MFYAIPQNSWLTTIRYFVHISLALRAKKVKPDAKIIERIILYRFPTVTVLPL
jgi:hypothetical protein